LLSEIAGGRRLALVWLAALNQPAEVNGEHRECGEPLIDEDFIKPADADGDVLIHPSLNEAAINVERVELVLHFQ